jgi:hypothetical protein
MASQFRAAAPLLVVFALLVAACGGPAAADEATAVVKTAVDRAGAKDIAGLQALACAGRAEELKTLIGLPSQLGGVLLPGVDTSTLVDAVRLDVSGLTVGAAVVTGDAALVPVKGSLKVTFDKDAMRPILEKLLAAQGTKMSPEQLDALLSGLADYGQDLPFDQQIKVVREQGAWKVCPDLPGPSSLPVMPGLPGIPGFPGGSGQPTLPEASQAPATPSLPIAP